ncbi:MAG: DUF6470 family protein [Oscillospiraceae bacterium]
MQLLQITTTPVKYELEIEPAKLQYEQDFTPSARVQTTPAKMQMQSKNAQVRIDTYEARKSLGIKKIGDIVGDNAQKGTDHLNSITREYVEIGKELGKTQNNPSISEIFRQKMIEQPEMYTAFLPSVGADISWSPAELNMSYEKGSISTDWQIKKSMLNYVPGSVHMKVVQLPSIEIKYLGKPMYVPPSASPYYEEPVNG